MRAYTTSHGNKHNCCPDWFQALPLPMGVEATVKHAWRTLLRHGQNQLPLQENTRTPHDESAGLCITAFVRPCSHLVARQSKSMWKGVGVNARMSVIPVLETARDGTHHLACWRRCAASQRPLPGNVALTRCFAMHHALHATI